MDIGSLLLSFEGRVNRKRYWLTAIALFFVVEIAAIIAYVIDGLIGTNLTLGGVFDTPSGMPLRLGVLTLIVYVLQLWPGIALAVKRCHDRGRSGWFLLLQLIPFVNIWVLVEILFLKGTTGPNRFGPDPLLPNAQAIGQVFS